MTSGKIGYLGLSAAVALAIAAVVTAYVPPGVAVSTPGHATPVAESRSDPAPQRFDLAQAAGESVATISGLPGGAILAERNLQGLARRLRPAGQSEALRVVAGADAAGGQRVLAIELNAPSGNTVTGALILPFGLALDADVTFQIDDEPAMQPVRFRTCIPAGCLVNIGFDAPTLATLRAGAALKVKAVADGGTAAPFSIPLQGFATALDRLEALSR